MYIIKPFDTIFMFIVMIFITWSFCFPIFNILVLFGGGGLSSPPCPLGRNSYALDRYIYSADPQTAGLYSMIDEHDFGKPTLVFAWRSKCSQTYSKIAEYPFSLSSILIILSLECSNTLILLRLVFLLSIHIDFGDLDTRVKRTRCRSSTETERRH